MNSKLLFRILVSLFVVGGLASADPSQMQMTNPRQVDPYVAGPVKNTIMKRAKLLQECWLATNKANPKVEKVKINLDWQITPEGKVTDPEVVNSDLDDSKFSQCLLKKINEIRFPPHEGKVAKYISHKFTFTKEEPEKVKNNK